MIWPALLFNLGVGLLLAGYLHRATRRFERTADRLLARLDREHAAREARLDREHEENMRKYAGVRDEIRAALRAQTDRAIAELKATPRVLVAATGQYQLTFNGGVSVGGSASVEVIQPVPTQQEIDALPRRARVAFAARCARRVLPLLGADDEALHRAVQELVGYSVEFAESKAVLDGGERVQADLAFPSLFHKLKGIAAGPRTSAVVAVVTAAVGEAYRQGGSSLAPAYAMMAFPAGDLRPAIRRDFETVRALAQANGWTDDTPVSPSVFGPLWPDGRPNDWPTPGHPVTEVVFGFKTPDDMARADAVAFVEELSAALCSLDLAGGGHGLTIQPPLEITASVPSPVGSPV